MSWKTLKLVAIAVLLALDLYFLVNVIIQYNEKNYYSGEEQEMAKNILKSENIYLSDDILSAKKQNRSAYSRDFSSPDLKKLLSGIYGDFAVFSSSTGYYIETGGGILNIEGGGNIDFLTSGWENLSEKLASMQTAEVEVTKAYERRFGGIISDFFGISKINSSLVNSGALKTEIKIISLSYNVEKGVYIAQVCQSFDGYSGDGIMLVVISGETVLAAKGHFAYLLPNIRYETVCVDLLDILLGEKRARGKEYAGEPPPPQKIEKIEYSFGIFYDSKGSGYYVPICDLIYSDGTRHSYNLVDGEIVK